jgi:hypothetical protein
MFRGTDKVRFCTDQSEAAVRDKVRQALAGLGQVAMGPGGVIGIEPREEFHSTLAETALSGRLRREWNEYEVNVAYSCRPTPAGWAVIALGTLPLLLGWLALLAPLSARRTVAEAVRQVLGQVGEALGGAVERRYGRKDVQKEDGPPARRRP